LQVLAFWPSRPSRTRLNLAPLHGSPRFGERTALEPTSALARAGEEPWSMFSLINAGADTDLLLLLPTLLDVLESDPLAQVLFMRDEMAAMAWGIEQLVEGALDRGVNGYEAWLQSLAQRAPSPPAASSEAPVRYLIGTGVPGNWLPLVPVQRSIRTFLFRRGIMGTPGTPPARGEILGTRTRLYIAEEAIPLRHAGPTPVPPRSLAMQSPVGAARCSTFSLRHLS
jgi:hypothetical protein